MMYDTTYFWTCGNAVLSRFAQYSLKKIAFEMFGSDICVGSYSGVWTRLSSTSENMRASRTL